MYVPERTIGLVSRYCPLLLEWEGWEEADYADALRKMTRDHVPRFAGLRAELERRAKLKMRKNYLARTKGKRTRKSTMSAGSLIFAKAGPEPYRQAA